MSIKLLVPTVLSVELQSEQTLGFTYPKVRLGDGAQRRYSSEAPSFEYENDYRTGWQLITSEITTTVRLPGKDCHIKVNTASIVDIVRLQPQVPFADIPLKLCEVTHLDEKTELVMVSELSLAALSNTPDCIQLSEENFVDVQAIKTGDTVLLGRQSYVVTMVSRDERENFVNIQIEFSLKGALSKKTSNMYTVHHGENYSAALYREATGQEELAPFLKYLHFMRTTYAKHLHSLAPTRRVPTAAQQTFSADLTRMLSDLLQNENILIEVPLDQLIPEGNYSCSTVSHLLRWSGFFQMWNSFSEDAITQYFVNNSELIVGDTSTSVIWNNAEHQYPEFEFHIQVKRARKKGFYILKSAETEKLYQRFIGDMPKELTALEVATFIQTVGENTLLCTRDVPTFTRRLQQLDILL